MSADTNKTTIVTAESFVTLHYRLSGPLGDLINTFADKPATINLGCGQLAPQLEQCLIGLADGARKVFKFAAGEVFGAKTGQLQQWLPRQLLDEIGTPGEHYVKGEAVKFPTPDGNGDYAGVVLKVEPQRVLFDFNHPLAGMPVEFEVQIIGVL